MNILTIDDKPSNTFALEKLLEKTGRTFLNATNGKDGLAVALSNDIDLIIIDAQMLEMDGFEVAQILKSNTRTEGIPIIFTYAEKKEIQSILKGFEEGVIDYLAKPLDPELTKAKVSVLLKIQLQKKELIEKGISLEKAEVQIKMLNADLQKNLAQLETTNKELESFSYSVSHDLRSPLRLLNGYAKILEDDYINKLDDGAKQLFDTIQRNISKMDNLIEGLLKFSRLGRKEIMKSEIDTASLVQNVLKDLERSASHHAKIIINPLLPAFADYELLTQVWINLISNAIKYSANTVSPYIEIGSERNENEIVNYIKDNGVGFNMQFADKLFGIFQRLHKANEFEGTGVGLAIVQRIVVRHGGKVWAEASVNEGATFYFSLPIE